MWFFSEKLNEPKQPTTIGNSAGPGMGVITSCQSLVLRSPSAQVFELPKEARAPSCKWVKFLQEYTFILKHCVRTDNRPTDALSRVVGSCIT